jgi:Flp pilus assembly pilin Flp
MKAKQQAGQGMVEYALLLLLVAIGTLLGLQLMGISVRDVYCRIASGFSANACSSALCQDDFNNLNGSQGVTGPWKTSDGQACIQGGGILLNKCSMNNMTGNDYTANIDGAALGAGDGYGIFFHATDTGSGINGYAFQYDPGLKGFVIRKWVNGREINPAIVYKSTPSFDWYGKPHTLSVKVVGNTFTGYVDGNVMLVGQDNTFTSGGAGIRTWDSTILCIDKFSINPTTP